MNYSNRSRPPGKSPRRGLSVVAIVLLVLAAGTMAVFAISNWLGPFPFGISRRDTTLLTLWNEGRYDEVLSRAEAVLEEAPLDPQALTFGGFAHFYVGIDQARVPDRQEHLQKSILLLRKAEHVNKAPLLGQRRYVLAKAYYHSGEMSLDVAARYMEESLSDGYVAKDTYAYLGLAYEGLGKHAKGAQAFESGLQLEDTAALRMKAADARAAMEQYSAAEEHLRSALESTNDAYLSLVLRIRLAAVLIEREQFQAAEQMLTSILEEYPDSADASYYLGVVYYNTDRAVEARNMWRTARELDPNHLKALDSLANWEG